MKVKVTALQEYVELWNYADNRDSFSRTRTLFAAKKTGSAHIT